jgi:hypothetical protein
MWKRLKKRVSTEGGTVHTLNSFALPHVYVAAVGAKRTWEITPSQRGVHQRDGQKNLAAACNAFFCMEFDSSVDALSSKKNTS